LRALVEREPELRYERMRLYARSPHQRLGLQPAPVREAHCVAVDTLECGPEPNVDAARAQTTGYIAQNGRA
jgi:hypothetical protein